MSIDLNKQRLQEILSTMDVPVKRKEDYMWLSMNLFIRNGDHRDLYEAMNLVEWMRRIEPSHNPKVPQSLVSSK